MANPYYNASGFPANQVRATSSGFRSEYSAVGTGFDGVYAQLVALAAAIGVPVTVTEVPVASGSTTDIGNGYGPVISITGTTTINSFGANYNGAKFIRFTGILTLTNSASLVLPGGANITTAAGDACIAVPIGNPASGWRVLSYCRMSKPMLDDDAIRASVNYSNPSWLTALAWSKITGTPTTRAGYGIVDAAGNGNNSDITSLSGLSGNIAFTGTGNRITGDFSNATFASRVAVQTSTSNSNTIFGLLPNGTATTSAFEAYNNSNPANAARARLSANTADVRLESGITGTGTYLPLTIYTGGTESAQVDTAGNFGIGMTPTYRLDVTGNVRITGAQAIGTTPSGNAGLRIGQSVDQTIGSNYSILFSGVSYSGGIALDATSMAIGHNSAVRSLTLHSGTAFAEQFRITGTGTTTLGGTSTAPAFKVNPTASQVNWPAATGAATGNPALLSAEGETNVGLRMASKGTGVVDFYTNSTVKQVEIGHTALANRYITLTGSNGGNPTISVSAGNLAITPTVVIGGNLTVSGGTVTATTFTGNAATATSATSATTATTATNQSGGTVAATTGTFSTSALVTGTGGIGYSTGAGGTVTQATSKATAVTLNTPTGKITTAADALPAASSIAFQFNNSAIGANDCLVVTLSSHPSTSTSHIAYRILAEVTGAGTAFIELTNQTGFSQSEAVGINFAVIKGATA